MADNGGVERFWKRWSGRWRQRIASLRLRPRGRVGAGLALLMGAVVLAVAGILASGVAGGSGPVGPPLPPGEFSAGLGAKFASVGAVPAHQQAVGIPPSRSEAPRRKGGRAASGRVTTPAAGEVRAPSPGEQAPYTPATQAKPSSRPAPAATPSSGALSQAQGRTEAQGYRNRRPVPGISNTPSKTEPYWACPHSLCEAIIVPHPQKKVSGHWAPAAGGRAYEGSGEFGAYSPKDLESAYNVFATQGGKENKEAEEKQTIALIDMGPYPNAEKDLNEYRKTYGLPECTHANGCFRHVNEAGEEGKYGAEEFGVETPLDLDMASAGCPNCHILLVSSNSDFMSDLGASAKKAAELGANAISNSYGAAEQVFNSEELNSDYHFKEGVMDYAASGDGGYLGVYYGQESLWYPAAQTYEISVGATALRHANNARGWSESTWWAAGGGCSRSEVKPAWQLDTACPHRADNDVTAVGAPETPVSVRFNGEWWLVAGTSAASPLVAGIETHASAFAHSLPGADAIYSDPAAFNDVTEGSIAPNGECELAILCNAGPAWDGPTGVGSPNGPITITSLPVLAVTTLASSVSGTAATLNGLIDPQGNETSYHFEYGTSASYGSSTTAASAGSGSARVPVSQALSGLLEGTTYHYRLVASHGSEAVYGQDSVFRTAAPTVTGVTPNVGAAGGGTSLTISGTNFAGVTAVKFGSSSARSFRVSSESSITATSPPGSGTVDVTVTTPSGTTATGAADRFHYERLLWQRAQMTPPDEGPWNLTLDGVSCVPGEWCMAVGTHQSEGWPYSFLPDAQIVSHGHWTVQQSASPGGKAAYPSEPLGTAVDSHGDVWVSDAGSHNRVEEFSAIGVFMRAIGWGVKDGKSEAEVCTETCQPGLAGSGPGQFKTPWSIAVAPNGDIWVVDSENRRLEEFTSEGTYVRQVTSSGMSGGEYTVKRMTVDREGNLWVSEPGTGQFQELSESGTVKQTITGLHIPTGIAIDGSGNIWIAEESYNRLDEYSSAGAFIRTTGWGVQNGEAKLETCTAGCQAGIAGTGNGQFDVPKSVAIDEKGNVWVINDVYSGNGEELKPESTEVKFVRQFAEGAYFEQSLSVGNGSVYTISATAMPVEQWPIPAGEAEKMVVHFDVPSAMHLQGVSCTAVNQCIAVGAYDERSQPYSSPIAYAALAERWNGQEWQVQQIPALSGLTKSELNAISCISATECVAVGAAEESSGSRVPFAAVWRNGAWSVQAPPEPSEGGKHTYLSEISCTSAKFCMAVGVRHEDRDANGEGYGRAFAEVWNGSSWAVTPTPELTSWSSYFGGVSCTSPSMCFAAGQYNHSGFGYVDLVERWNGKEWAQETAAPELGSSQAGWSGVSCTSPESCTLVGNHELRARLWVSGAETWNGRTWTSQTTPDASTGVELRPTAVSCVGNASCVAVGYRYEFYAKQYAEIRAENTMATQATPMETESTRGVLAGSSCVSSTTCIAVGSYDKKGTTTPVGLADEWNGFKWSAIARAPASPSGGTSVELHHVSCEPNGTGSGGSYAACTAVGSYKNSSGTIMTLAERWNGSEWKVQPTENPSGATGAVLSGVSCSSATYCTAVGSYTNSSGTIETLAERWNGSEWKGQSTPHPANAKESQLTGVSCTSATNCSAVGFFRIGATPNADMSLAESWNGTEWKLQTPENPSGATKIQLSGVSCSAASACTAVGSYTNSAGNTASLAESWNGSEWQIQALEGPEGAAQSKLQGVSCDALGGCTAVGWSKQGTGNATPLAELWSGLEWKPLAIPSPSTEGGELLDVSCLMVDACEAAGTYTSSSKVGVSLAEGLGAPGASTGQAKELSHFGATLTGSAQQNQWFTSYHFEYGETTSYGTSVPVANIGLFSESGVNEVAQAISGLKQNTTYHFRLVATSEGGTTYGQDQTLTSVATPTPGATTGPASEVSQYTATITGTVTPNNWATTYYFEYGETSAYGSKIPVPEASVKSETTAEEVKEKLTGLVPSKAYHYRLVANNSGNITDGEDKTFTTAAIPTPGATTGPASEVSQYTGTITGTVTPNNWATTYYFEYGETSAYGSKIPVPEASVKSETTPEEVKEKLTGLVPSKTYHYRLVANNTGTIKDGEDKTFTTAAIPTPGATTGSTTSITWDTGVISGTVTPNNWATTYYFEYGPTTAYGSKIPVPEASVKSETTPEEVKEQITGLVPSKTYHYRLVANNTGTIKDGEDKTFTTAAATVTPTFTTAFGSPGSGTGQLSGPRGDAVDSNGNVWVSDTTNNRVAEFSSSGEFKLAFGWGVKDGKAEAEVCASTETCQAGIAGSGPGQLSEPSGIATEGGQVWVVDRANNRVEEFSSAGVYLNKQIEVSPGYNNAINGVALDGHGDMFVTGSSFGSLQKFSIATGQGLGQVLTWINGYRAQYGVAVDQQGNVWETDAGSNRVREFSNNLEFKLALGWGVKDGEAKFETCTTSESECKEGAAGSGEGQFNNPGYLTFDTNGDLWVVDQGNNRIEEFSPRDEYITQFGSAGSGTGQFSNPQGIAIANGFAYVADSGNSRVEKWNVTAPTNTASFGSLGSGSGQLSGPRGDAVDASGNVWVSDAANNRVAEFSSSGEFKLAFGWGVKDGKAEAEVCASTETCQAGVAGSGPGQLSEPSGIATEGGQVWVVDRANNRVEEFSSAGVYLNKQIAVSAAPYNNAPNGVALDGHGDMFVTGSTFGSIQKFSIATGEQVAPQFLTNINGYIAQYGVAVDQQGNVWVADGNRVREFSNNLEFKLAFGWGVKDGEAKSETCVTSECKLGTAGSGEGEFNNSGYLTVDAAGNLWVADQGNHRVQELSPSGQYITQFGSAGSGAGQFSSPQGIAVTGGLAYVVDSGNNRVEKWGVLE